MYVTPSHAAGVAEGHTDTASAHCLHERFEQQVRRTPDRVAAVFEGQSCSYRELNARANRLARHLRALGVGPDVRVGVCVDRSQDMIASLLAVLKAGGAYVPLDPFYPRDRLAFMVEDADLRLVLTQRAMASRPPLQGEGAPATVLVDDEEAFRGAGDDDLPCVTTPENLAYVIYTSGSTGRPKGVEVLHRGLVNLLDSMARRPGLVADDVVMALTTISFDIAALELYLPLLCGARTVIAGRGTAADPMLLAELLDACGVTFMQATPATWRMLIESGWRGDPARLTVLSGGEAMTRELADQLLGRAARVWNVYGPTETTVWSMAAEVAHGAARITLGEPVAHTQIYLLDGQGRPVPAGEIGEIHIGGAGLARGYLNRPELTRERFIERLDHLPSAGRVYKTGDLARLTPEGGIEFLGRTDQQVKIRGHRIELGEIEATLERHPAVASTAVVARGDDKGERRLAAYVVPRKLGTEASEPDGAGEADANWHGIWDDTYRQSGQDDDPTFNISGWNDSYTGLPLPPHEVREWVDHTVASVLALRPKRLLEIGCGTGLLLFRLADHCSRYCGTDISEEAVRYIGAQAQRLNKPWPHVELKAQAAHEFGGVPDTSFDTVVINSVIQYFPGVDYLVNVLEDAVRMVSSGGVVFVGDVRSLPLLKAFHASVQARQAPPELTGEQLQERIDRRLSQEAGLVLDPDFFHALRKRIPRIGAVEIRLKRGRSQNELNRFRYDVLLHVSDDSVRPAARMPVEWVGWNVHFDAIAIGRQLEKLNGDKAFGISRIPNRRVFADIATARLAAEAPTVADLRRTLRPLQLHGIHPEDLFALETEHPYTAHVTWHGAGRVGYFDVLFVPVGDAGASSGARLCAQFPDRMVHLQNRPLADYANVPFRDAEPSLTIRELREFLEQSLPGYMVPEYFVFMDALPLSGAGKVDRNALPVPFRTRPRLAQPFAAARDALEERLAGLWSQALGLDAAGIHDNFFELGGHSLLSAQVCADVNHLFGVRVALAELFEQPTIAGLANVVRRRLGHAAMDAPAPISATPQADLSLELPLPAVLPPSRRPSGRAVPAHAFLTGATGFLGVYLLHELLAQTPAVVSCLVRCLDPSEGHRKLVQHMKRHRLWSDRFDARIRVVPGDLALERFGLPTAEFDRLAQEVDTIHHCGAHVNLLLPYPALRAANVLGTREVLRLAGHARLKPVHHVSSLAVFESPECRRMPSIGEIEASGDGLGLDSGYAQSKFVAEHLMRAAQAAGVPVTIYRPGMVSGHSGTGISNTGDMVCRLVKEFIDMGSVPALDLSIDLTPVDYVSRAIVHLSTRRADSPSIFHLTNPKPVPLHELARVIESWGHRLQELPYEDWQRQLRQACERDAASHALAPLLSVMIDKLPGEDKTYLEASSMCTPHFDCSHAEAGLTDSAISCPPAAMLLQAYHAYFLESGFLKRPQASKSAASHP